MKKIIKILSCLILLASIIISCKKEVAVVTFDGGTNPVLAVANPLTTTMLLKSNENNTWNTLKWTNPNYQLSNGTNSQNVTYTVQFDTTGSNFTNPNKGEISIANDLSTGFLVKDLNKLILGMGLLENIPHNMEIRVKSSLINNTIPYYSNVLKVIITPYLDVKVTLPADLPSLGANNGDLFLVGNATTGDVTGWNNPVPTPSQKFTRINTFTYEINYPLIGGKQYLLLPKNGDWGHKYAVVSNTVPGLSLGGDFDADKSDNFPGPGTSGNYKIVVNFKTGKFIVTPI
jgi:starch-binding outer membrane protein SusE/F